MVMGEKSKSLEEMPCWLEYLLREKFFTPCLVHEGLRKNEKNIMCVDCSSSLCPYCIPPHRPHRLLQIRRYVYHDVVRVEDLERLFDLDSIQTYITNSKKVVFINERNQGRPINERGLPNRPINHCHTCRRGLHQDHYLFCCLSCKVKLLLGEEGLLTRHLRECRSIPPPTSLDLEECQLSPGSILDATSSGSSGPGAASPNAVIRRSRSYSYRLSPSEPAKLNRRKQSNARRSPFF